MELAPVSQSGSCIELVLTTVAEEGAKGCKAF